MDLICFINKDDKKIVPLYREDSPFLIDNHHIHILDGIQHVSIYCPTFHITLHEGGLTVIVVIFVRLGKFYVWM